MFKIEMKAGELAALITKMTARESGGTALFSPMIANVNVKGGTMKWSWITSDHTAFTWGKATKLKLSGKDGEYVFDSEIIEWINKLFGAEEKVSMEHRGESIYLKGDKYEAQLTPTDADATRVEEASQMKIDEKTLVPKLGSYEWNEVSIKASEINAILAPTSLVYPQKEIKVVRLSFNKKGSFAIIGSLEAHSMGVSRPIEAKVKKGFDIILGSNFAEVMSVIDGDIKLFGIDKDRPLWILKQTETATIGYLVAQYDESQAEKDKQEAEEEKEKKEKDEEEPEEEEDKVDV